MDDHKEPGTEFEVDLEDLEVAVREGRVPRRAKQYRFRVDREYFTVEKPVLTGREILTMAGKVPVERFMLSQKLKGGRTDPVGLDDKVDLRTPGVERFMTLPKDQTEGQDDASAVPASRE